MRTLLLFVLFSVFALSACSSSNLPPIGDAAQLKADCDALLQTDNPILASDVLPKSIKSLNPAAVVKRDAAIWITIHAQTGEGAWGYVVAPARPASINHYLISTTEYSGIYRFDFVP